MSGYSTFGSLYDTDVLYGITPDGDGTCIQDRDVILFQTSELDMQDKKRIVKRRKSHRKRRTANDLIEKILGKKL